MAKKESGFSPASITSIRPDNDAEWIEPFNSLLVDLEEERFHSRLLKRCRRGKSARNALVQDLIDLGLDTLKNQSQAENTISVNLDGLPPETISFLSSPQGQVMVRNLLLTFTTGIGNGFSIPSPIMHQPAFLNEAPIIKSETKTFQQVAIEVPNDTNTLEVRNNTIEKAPMVILDEFESAVDTEFEKELIEIEQASQELAPTNEKTCESSVERKSKFEKWKKRGDIGRS